MSSASTSSAPISPAPIAASYVSPSRYDLRRGVIWLGLGLGLVSAGLAFYAGLYNIGGSQQMLSIFSAMGSIPIFVGLTYLALWAFERRKTNV